MKVYHLLTRRVRSLNSDSTPNIEEITVKLEGEAKLKKYCEFVVVNGYVKQTPPEVVNVFERNQGASKEISAKAKEAAIIEGQKIVDEVIEGQANAGEVKDYKAEHEKQLKRNDELEARLKALEEKQPKKPGPKAKKEPATDSKV